MATATRAAPRYNPDLRRHSWNKLREHVYECRFCTLRRENVGPDDDRVPGRRRDWFTIFAGPRGVLGSTRYGGKVPDCPGPEVA